MGKVTRSILGVALTMAFVATASADSTNWFVLDANNTGPGVQVIGGGTAGTTLRLEKGMGPSTTTIAVILRSQVSGTPLKGYTFNMGSDNDAIETASAVTLNSLPIQDTPTTINGAAFGPGGEDIGTASTCGNLVHNLGESELFNEAVAVGQTRDLLRITFTITKSGASAGTIDIFGATGLQSWDDLPTETAAFGPNAAFLVGSGRGGLSVGNLPLITITNVIPEPGTLALLGMGCIGLLRRRRQNVA
jgi:hypothetical protein